MALSGQKIRIKITGSDKNLKLTRERKGEREEGRERDRKGERERQEGPFQPVLWGHRFVK